MRPVSLYLHIPFCRTRCAYCGFVSGTALEKQQDYLDALCRTIASAPLDGCEAATIYFGGGTPTLLGEGLLTALASIRRRLPLTPDAEITLEANPGTVTPELLRSLREGGFNRISFGLQDSDDAVLRLLGRGHTASEGREAAAMARTVGFENISVDFMLATPGQTPEKARRLAEYGAALGVPHISSYLLKVEPGTPFFERHIERECPDADAAADCYLAFYEALEAAGYRHYEISNAAYPGFESRHNSAYWKLAEFLGIGPGAASFFDGRRFRFGDDTEAFITDPDPWKSVIDEGPGGGWEEAVMLALRLADGLSPELAAQYGQDYGALLRRASPLQKAGLLIAAPQRISLTDRGFLLSNSIILALTEGE